MALPMLFCNIELKIYVPDGFEGRNLKNYQKKKKQKTTIFFFVSDFMAMLSDPGAFTKGAEKQAETMKGMGIEQTDAKAEAKKKEEEQKKKDEWKLEPITLDTLRKDKAYKAGKKFLKDMDTMKKKHLKERQTMQKNHVTAIEKLTKGKEWVVQFLFL